MVTFDFYLSVLKRLMAPFWEHSSFSPLNPLPLVRRSTEQKRKRKELLVQEYLVMSKSYTATRLEPFEICFR